MALLALTVSVPPASAGGKGDARTKDNGIDLTAETEPGVPAGHPVAAPDVVCTLIPLSPEDAAIADRYLRGDSSGQTPPDGPGGWYFKVCNLDSPFEFGTVLWLPAQVDPRALAEEAKRRLALGKPAVAMAPPVGKNQLVNEPTWLWIDRASWQRRTATVAAGGVTVTAAAEPVRAIWDMGDGSPPIVCGPGTPYDPAHPVDGPSPDCGHTYTRPSTGRAEGPYRVAVTIEWQASWTVTGAPGGGDLGVLRPSTVLRVPVVESQAVNTKPSQ